jgi:hypothetical protein
MDLQSHRVHPVVACASAVAAAVKDVADVDPAFMATGDKKQALLGLARVAAQLEELRLRVLGSADDVAADEGARDAAAWLAHHARLDRFATRRDARLAAALEVRCRVVSAGLREGGVNRDQAHVLVRALDALPEDLDPEVRARAEERLVAEAARFGPRQLRILGRRILEVIAPEVAEEAERRALEREEVHAAKVTSLRTRRLGDGTTEIITRVADLHAHRFFTYLEAFTSPRQSGQAVGGGDRRPYDQRLGHAFVAFLEAVDPDRLPLHGGDATTVIVTLDHQTLLDRLDASGVALVGDEPITASQARRLACTAKILPAVLGGASEVLDLGRARRLFSPAQRKAMAIRDVTCRAEGCEIPAAWCEAHHANKPWARGGKTDLADGALLCSFHHHRAHDHRYQTRRQPTGDLTFHRRT